MERGIPGLLFYEDHDETLRTPYMHTANDTRPLSLNDDALYLANARSAAATLMTLARPVRPPAVVLYVTRDPGDPESSVRLDWSGGFAPFDVHRDASPEDLGSDLFLYASDISSPAYADLAAAGDRLYYSIEY